MEAVNKNTGTAKAKLTHRNVGATAWNKEREELITIKEVMVNMGSVDKSTPCDLYRVENSKGQLYCVEAFHITKN